METDTTQAGQTTAPDTASPAPVTIHTFKGTDMNLQCRGFQFEVGKTYTHEGSVKACNSGFHACENPLDVFGYYSPGTSKFLQVEQSGEISLHVDDSKVASASISIKAELSLPDFITKAFNWVLSKCSPATSDHATGYQSASSATGDRSASSATGDRSASSVIGNNSVAMNIGIQGKSKAAENGAIVVCNHDEHGSLCHIRASKVGENGIKPDTFYILNDKGEFEEAQA